MRNKKGSILTGMMVFLVSAISTTGMLFSGGPGNTAGSGMLLSVTALTAYSQMPHVVEDFRQKKAVREFGVTMEEAKALSADELLDLIRDDAPGYTSRANLIKENSNLYLGG
ncbi:unnamed protein product [marine sediment metagenome]|uniref:Uncharacterized protein n=1 Tax=marine sediment metagenome TaxID=412755 RepID=X0UFE9_9ZZZZ